MGNVCCKLLGIGGRQESLLEKHSDKGVREKDGVDARVTMIDVLRDGSKRFYDDQVERMRRKSPEIGGVDYPGMGSVPNAVVGEQIAAGWPSWLAESASEAIKGWVPRHADSFDKLAKIGQGAYSNVYKARDRQTGKIVAMKKVRVDSSDPKSVKFMAREILVLRRLNHPNIIKLECLATTRMSYSLYLVFEYMEHDLRGVASLPGFKFTEPQVKNYMHQLLTGLDYCHSHGILHRDIKGANLLIDNHGTLKIADFGLARVFNIHRNVPMTSHITTLWYRPPELLLGVTKYGVGVDLWSTGCVLGELFAGRPIIPGSTEVEQLHKIFKLCGSPSEEYKRKLELSGATLFKFKQDRRCVAETFKDFPAAAIGLMETLLSIDPASRGNAADALNSEFLTAEPFARQPLSLQNSSPVEEYDVKLKAARRRRVARRRLQREQSREMQVPEEKTILKRLGTMKNDPVKHETSGLFRPSKEAVAFRLLEIDGTYINRVATSMKEDTLRDSKTSAKGSSNKRQGHSDIQKEKFEIRNEVVTSKPLFEEKGRSKAMKNINNLSIDPTRAESSSNSGHREETGPSSQLKATINIWLSDFLKELESPGKQDQKRPRWMSGTRRMGDGSASASAKESSIGHRSTGNRTHLSGRSCGSSKSVDLIIREHDRLIQESTQQNRSGKMRLGKFRPQGMQVSSNPALVSGRGANRINYESA